MTHGGRHLEVERPMELALRRPRATRGRFGAVDVMLTGGEHVGVLAAARSLAAAGHRPWVAVSWPRTYAARSRAVAGLLDVPDPAENEAGFVYRLREFAAGLPAAALLPGTEAALLAISDRRDWFPEDVALGMSSSEAVRRATDKTLLASLAEASGLRTPETVMLSADDAAAEGLTLSFPVVVKPFGSELRASNGRLVHVRVTTAGSRQELLAALEAIPGRVGIVQRYLHGRIRSVAGVCWGGELVASVHSVAERIWPVDCGLISSAVTVPPDRGLDRGIAALLQEVGWNGLFQVDFIEHGGEAYLIDLNPRIYTSLALATAAGVNLPLVWVNLLLGRDPGTWNDYRVGCCYRREDHDARALAMQLRRGRRLAALRGLLPRRRTVHAVFSMRDPLPLLTTLERVAGRRYGPA